MHRIVHFEIHAPDPKTAMDFYTANFGWKFTRFPGPMEYWIADTGDPKTPGINGGLMKSQSGQPLVVNTIEVADVDAAVAKALKTGGTLALAKMPIPGVGWLAYCKDPAGNIFGVYKNDPSATQ